MVDATQDPDTVHKATVEAVWERLGPEIAAASPSAELAADVPGDDVEVATR